jgi:hypothetical protein
MHIAEVASVQANPSLNPDAFAEAGAESEAALIGHWQTIPTLSQLGTIVIEYRFDDRGAFTSKVTFIDADIPAMTASGTYTFEPPNKIHLKGPRKDVEATFTLQNDELILDEGPAKVFHLKRGTGR